MPYIWTATEIEQPLDRAFTRNNIQYPRNWLRHSSADGREAIGLEWIDDDRPRVDERFFTVRGRRGDWAVTPRDADELRAGQVETIKKVAANKLAGSDWMVVRAAEGGTAVPQDWAEWRVAVRAASNDAEAAVGGADFEGLQVLQQDWPESPEEKAMREKMEAAAAIINAGR
jgi:hypothetical protein